MIQLDRSLKILNSSTPSKLVAVNSRVVPWLTSIAYPLGRYGLLPFYFNRIEVKGREHLPTTGPVILAPTHRARWDALMVPYAAGKDITGRELRFMVSANEMTGLQGFLIRRLGGFPIDTEQPGISSFRHGVELLLDGEAIAIFPEGNIFRDGRVHPLKRGVARIALQAEQEARSSGSSGLGVKIVPMSISYSQPIPKWRCQVKIQIGSPLLAADYSQMSAKRGARQLTADLETALKELEA
ncbi:MAG: 1-acyl-sn-glycerol-3-phosphate acyltransferase [Cyanosarcina radialis HA8281-LM2]|jgi:1-acyl-sn-glycerol-3-phosphate acyltransferase|nr:1-acyl-sn-glycerol-3-phosphate acyltransferase [Cyanosarcina radialis HA8281-LM2]